MSLTQSPRYLITGASSGIGEELARQLAKKGYVIGLVARRKERLNTLKEELIESQGKVFICAVDLTNEAESTKAFNKLVSAMGGLDGIILNAGVGRDDLKAQWESDAQTIDINIRAFAHGLHWAFAHFQKQGHGHIVGMSSIASHLASGHAPVYTASKHFVSNYMTGFRMKVNALNMKLDITDIRPGYVVSEMTQNNPNTFWMASTHRAVKMMIPGIEKKKKRIYISFIWIFIFFFNYIFFYFI